MGRHHGRHCRCQACKTIVYPTKYNCVNQYSESTVNHVHPSHTTVMNHHTVKNNHLFPHSTSVQNTSNSVNQYGAPFEVPAPNQVAGAYSPSQGYGMNGGQVMGAMQPGYGMNQGPGGQVMGAMQPGYGMKHGPGGQVMGSMSPGYGMQQGQHWKKPGKWC